MKRLQQNHGGEQVAFGKTRPSREDQLTRPVESLDGRSLNVPYTSRG